MTGQGVKPTSSFKFSPGYVAGLIDEYFGDLAPRQPGRVEGLCGNHGITVKVAPLAMGVRGTLDYSYEGLVITVNDSVSALQRGQVLGHELGHMIIDELMQMGHKELRQGRISESDLERLCDDIALDLVLPPAWIRQVGSELHRFDLEGIGRLGASAGVTKGAFLYALNRRGLAIAWASAEQARGGRWRRTRLVGQGTARSAVDSAVRRIDELAAWPEQTRGHAIGLPGWRVDLELKGTHSELFALAAVQDLQP